MTGIIGWRPEASGVGAKDLLELVPAIGDRVQVGHIGHRAARGEIRQDHRLVRHGEHVCRLRHEVHAAEDDDFGLGTSPRGVRELERVADEVGILNDLVALIEVAEDHEAFAERRLSGADAEVQFALGSLTVLLGKEALLRRPGWQRVMHRSPGTVSRLLAIKHPRRVRQGRRADIRGTG